MADNERSLAPHVIITMIVAALLALLASFGVYQAAQPTANSNKQAQFDYGDNS